MGNAVIGEPVRYFGVAECQPTRRYAGKFGCGEGVVCFGYGIDFNVVDAA